ncbi:MAG TPA: pyridoxal 5'-phosphate synthase glutaminase subunit PdxT [Dehalococcoidia bacterium]|nr:pyridoxal 5'-phosphate synthase glutaminase subunit PdxT [Dehalococcoidia bacterium]
MATVGVLALQGDFAEHESMLKRLGVDAPEVRLPSDLEGLDALIIPGGESTTITRLMEAYGLIEPIRTFARDRPVWGTCAGAIVMARSATDLDRPTLDLIDIEVKRNAFGRQVDSFETDIPIAGVEGGPLHAVFIRAPIIASVGEGVEVLGRLESGEIVAVRQGKMLATSFHPELTDDLRMHALFVSMAKAASDGS